MRSILLVSTLILASGAVAAEDCAAIYRMRVKTDMARTYDQFDQTENSGFRVLAAMGCNKEAADLIEEYMRVNRSTGSSLRWHVAQMRATAGDTKAAIRWAKSVLTEKEDFAKDPFRWNDYVLATIAFLERDKKALLLHRNNVAAGKEAYFGNELNLRLLDSLVKHFDNDYKYATSHIGK